MNNSTQTALTTTQNTSLSVLSPSSDEWRIITEQSQMLLKSGFLPQSIKTPEQAVAIILQGRELGIPTMAALGTINVIQGKPTVSPQLMLALINRSGQCENVEVKGDENGVLCTMKRRGRSSHSEFFGAKEAAAMGLSGKDNYKKQAATMYRWRAVAACARVVFPDVVLGLYTPEEMGAENVNIETGEYIPEAQSNIREMPPTKSQLVEKARSESTAPPKTDPLNKQIAELCANLNDVGDSIKWTSATLTEYANDLFGTEVESWQKLDSDQKTFLSEDLQNRGVELSEQAAIAEESAETEAVDGEIVEADATAQRFADKVF